MMNDLHYADLTGFKLIPVYDHMLRSIGVHSKSGEKSAAAVKRYFGNFLVLLAVVQGWSSTVAAYDSLKEEDFKAVTNVMSYMSVTLSSLSKFQIARTHMQVIHRLGNWMVDAKKNRPRGMEQPRLEALVLKVNSAFFYFALFAFFFWCSVPLTNNLQAFIPTKYPFLDKQTSNSISFPLVQIKMVMAYISWLLKEQEKSSYIQTQLVTETAVALVQIIQYLTLILIK